MACLFRQAKLHTLTPLGEQAAHKRVHTLGDQQANPCLLGRQFHIAQALQGIAQPLLGIEQHGTCCGAPIPLRHAGGTMWGRQQVPTCFKQRPTLRKLPGRQAKTGKVQRCTRPVLLRGGLLYGLCKQVPCGLCMAKVHQHRAIIKRQPGIVRAQPAGGFQRLPCTVQPALPP
jgi:hypothetical protein